MRLRLVDCLGFARTGAESRGLPKAYLALSVFGIVQAVYDAVLLPETLEVAKRRPMDLAAALNPLGFVNVFRKGSAGLRKMVLSVTCQMVAEGKNLSDLGVNAWMPFHLNWGVPAVSNYTTFLSIMYFAGGQFLVPHLLERFPTVRGFT